MPVLKHRLMRACGRAAAGVLAAGVLAGCGSDGGYADLQMFMDEVDARPKGQIEPLPPFVPYKPFTYRAANKRSPFEPPVVIRQVKPDGRPSDVEPNFNRVKEFLEQFPVGQLRMVGTLEQRESLFALVQDPEGGVHRVVDGDYMGTDFGRIIEINDVSIELREIVPDGTGGWVERARTVALAGGG